MRGNDLVKANRGDYNKNRADITAFYDLWLEIKCEPAVRQYCCKLQVVASSITMAKIKTPDNHFVTSRANLILR
jgi:hypothetical protein